MQPQFEELTEAQWQVIKEILKDNRKRKHNLRDVVDGILKILRTVTQWRNLNHPKLTWQIIYYYFRRWKINGTLERLNSCLNKMERIRQSRKSTPSLLCIDSQSIKSAPFVNQDKGIDGTKFVNGRNRHLIVDTPGLVWGVVVHAADIHDGTKAHLLIEHCLGYLERMNRIAEAKSTC